MTARALATLFADIEGRLAEIYGFSPRASAIEHLVTREELVATLGDGVATLPEFQARAGVFLTTMEPVEALQDQDLFIGIHIDPPALGALASVDPGTALTDVNLDPYCLVVEEVSHFHLILNRLDQKRGVSKLELEWQGEIDKLLLCASTLAEQKGDLHLLPLARRLFDQGHLTGVDAELYWQATRHAARFWFEALRGEGRGGLSHRLKSLLRRVYHAPWAEKVATIDRLSA